MFSSREKRKMNPPRPKSRVTFGPPLVNDSASMLTCAARRFILRRGQPQDPLHTRESTHMSENSGWYYADAGNPVGPLMFDELIAALGRRNGMETMVYGPGMANWSAGKTVDRVAARLR